MSADVMKKLRLVSGWVLLVLAFLYVFHFDSTFVKFAGALMVFIVACTPSVFSHLWKRRSKDQIEHLHTFDPDLLWISIGGIVFQLAFFLGVPTLLNSVSLLNGFARTYELVFPPVYIATTIATLIVLLVSSKRFGKPSDQELLILLVPLVGPIFVLSRKWKHE